jgi:hypothetical protein
MVHPVSHGFGGRADGFAHMEGRSMNEDRNPLDFFVKIARYIFDVIARTLVELFDGAKKAIDHSNVSLFALVATLLPFALPLPVAFMSSHSAQKFFGWEPWAANVLGFGIEGLGLLAWVRLVDSILDYVHSDNQKITVAVVLYGLVAVVYETLLIILNAVLAARDGADQDYVIVLTLVCLLPALSATLYGAHKANVSTELEREKQEAKDLAERVRQEARADRKEARELKLKYAADTKGEKLDKPFRRS